MQVARRKMARGEVFVLTLACALGLSALAYAEPAKDASQVSSAPGASSATPASSPSVLPSDATLAQLIRDSIAARPELARAKATLRASQERVPQASTLPDPMLQVGIQNDGFKSIEVGRMETSYISLMASQTFPWPGKRDLRGRIAALDIGEAQRGLVRQALSTEADVRRAYLDLLLTRDRLALLAQLELLWQNSLALTRIAYQSGIGSQSDMFRAQLEVQRLKQRRINLQTEEAGRLQILNRLRNRPLTEPIDTRTSLRQLTALEAYRAFFSAEKALSRSPELAVARVAVTRANESATLAERSAYPDLTVGAGIMYRGALPPMWLVTLGAPVPIFSGPRQSHAAAESRAWASAGQSQVAELEQLIRLRTQERELAFGATLDMLAVYDQGLLIQSQATAESALTQYRVGKGSFSAVLEAQAGLVADQEGYLDLLANAHRILIAEAELSLADTPIPSSGVSSGGMPGASAKPMNAPTMSSTAGASPSRAAAPSSAGSSSGM